MITLRFHGPLKSACPEPIKVMANTVAEAIEAVSRQLPGLKPDIHGGRKAAMVVGHDTVEDLYRPVEGNKTIDLVPGIFYSGGPRTQIIIGALLIVTAVMMGGVFWPAIIASMGASLMIGGIMQLLAPQQKLSGEAEEKSRYLGTPPNTVGIGTRIPILLGKDLCQGHLLSSDIDAAEVA